MEELIKRNRVFVLGAGFSADAGIPLTSPLLKKAINKFSFECPSLFSRVEGYIKEMLGKRNIDYSSVSFSELCTYLEYVELTEYGGGERWTNTGSREKTAFRFYLAKTIVEHTPDETNLPDLYLEFAKQLHSGDIIISFNWDGLLEVALSKVGKKYTYNFESKNAIKLCKLHGSVNWRLNEFKILGKPINTLSWNSLKFTKGIMDTEIYQSSKLLVFNNWKSFLPLGEVDPFLVLPGFGKAFDVRYNAVNWYKPGTIFSYTHDVFIIGLSLAKDDFFIRSLFLSILPNINCFSRISGRHIFIINPSKNAKKDYTFVLSKKKYASLLNQNFSFQHIALMKDRLTNF